MQIDFLYSHQRSNLSLWENFLDALAEGRTSSNLSIVLQCMLERF